MQNLVKLLVSLTFGVFLGLAATYLSVVRGGGFGAVRAGPWIAWPKTGSNEADPYARAVLSRSGEVPLGLAEGLLFIARVDDDGAPLDGRCAYLVGGNVPPARYWTLTVMTPTGRLIENATKHYGLTSSDVFRRTDGQFEIAVSKSAHSGNWLPTGQADRFILVFRLYDTSVTATASALDSQSMLQIRREGCG